MDVKNTAIILLCTTINVNLLFTISKRLGHEAEFKYLSELTVFKV
jgi:hypothetical protein